MLSLITIAFAVCFSVALLLSIPYSLLSKSDRHIFSTSLSVLLFSIIVLLFFMAAYRFFSRLTRFGLNVAAGGLAAAMILFEWVIIAGFSILPPTLDGGHTYGEALYLLAHGHASGDFYYKVYPNNIPITVLRYWLYRLFSMVHFSNYMLIDKTACAVVLNVGIYFSWKLVNRLFDAKMGNLFLLMTLTSFPLFFYITYFYTDTVTLMFPAMFLYLWYLYHRSMKIRYLFLAGLLLGIGYEIRPNLILFLPALAIYMLFVLRLKKVLLNLIVIGAMMVAAGFFVHAYDQHLGYTSDPSLSMPTTHWIMLGLSRYGEYNGADYMLTRNQHTQQGKIQVDVQQIKSRIIDKGVPGLVDLWVIKTAETWSIGSRGFDIYTDVSAHPTMAYEYVFGRQNQLVLYIVQIFHVVNLFLLAFSALNYFRTNKVSLNILIQICLLGNFVFYVFLWEAEPRYSLLFTPFMILGAVFGFNEFWHAIHGLKAGRFRKVMKGKMPVWILSSFLMVCVIACAWMNVQKYARDLTVQNQYIVDQKKTDGIQSAFVDAHHAIRQTFRASSPFTHVSLSVYSKKGQGVYNFSIANLSSHKNIFSKNFTSAQVGPGQDLTFSLKEDAPGTGSQYQITVRQISGAQGGKLGFWLYGNGYDRGDIYPDGQFMETGAQIKNADLKFQVYSIQERPYLSMEAYCLLFSIPVLMLLFYAYVFLKGRSGKINIKGASDL